MLVETFPRGKRFYMIAYPFEGKLAHQTLVHVADPAGWNAPSAQPLGYRHFRLCRLNLGPAKDMGAMIARGRVYHLRICLTQDMLGDDLEAWLDESFIFKRTFRYCALIAGLIDKRHPGKEKSGRQVTVSIRPDL